MEKGAQTCPSFQFKAFPRREDGDKREDNIEIIQKEFIYESPE